MENLFSKILNHKKYFILTLFFLVVVSALLNIILFNVGFFSISADESGRMIHAYKWVNNDYNGIPTWLPFYTIVMGYGVTFFPDLFWTPRIINSLFGILAFISFIWMSHEIFKDRYITLLSALIALFFPSRVILSTVPLAESMFYFFIFSGLVLFLRWFRTNQNYLLILSALAFAFSSSVRYEGWVFAVSFIAALIFLKKFRKENIGSKIIFISSLITFIFPVYWIIYQGSVTDNPLHFFSDVNKNYENAMGISFSSILINNYLTRFVHHNLIYICFPGIIALVYLFFRDSMIRKWMIVPTAAFIPLIVLSLAGKGIPTHNIWRIPELWNILLIPFTAYFIKNLELFEIKSTSLKKIIVPVFIVFIIIYYSIHINRYLDDYGFRKEELKIGRYLKNNLIGPNTKNKILIEVPDWSYLHITIASNNPENIIRNSGVNPKIKADGIIDENSAIDPAKLLDRNITYLLFKSKDLKEKIAANPFFKERKRFKEWVLYQSEF